MKRAAFLSLFLVACGPGPDPVDPTDDPTDTPATVDVALAFAATIDGEAVSCAGSFPVGQDLVSAQVADARLFVSAVELRNAEGDWIAVDLEQDGMWQVENVALLDFEDGTGACADSGTPELNASVVGTLPEGTYDAVRFDVGVPFELNHVDNTTAPAPLNAPGMFWTWQGGYKFVRVDFMDTANGIGRWNTHIGSTACASDAPVVAPAEPCGHPNRPTITLEGVSVDGTVDLDLAALLAGTDLYTDTPDTPPGCMSSVMEPDDCTATFASLGLDFATGICPSGDCSGQTVFGGVE